MCGGHGEDAGVQGIAEGGFRDAGPGARGRIVGGIDDCLGGQVAVDMTLGDGAGGGGIQLAIQNAEATEGQDRIIFDARVGYRLKGLAILGPQDEAPPKGQGATIEARTGIALALVDHHGADAVFAAHLVGRGLVAAAAATGGIAQSRRPGLKPGVQRQDGAFEDCLPGPGCGVIGQDPCPVLGALCRRGRGAKIKPVLKPGHRMGQRRA